GGGGAVGDDPDVDGLAGSLVLGPEQLGPLLAVHRVRARRAGRVVVTPAGGDRQEQGAHGGDPDQLPGRPPRPPVRLALAQNVHGPPPMSRRSTVNQTFGPQSTDPAERLSRATAAASSGSCRGPGCRACSRAARRAWSGSRGCASATRAAP